MSEWKDINSMPEYGKFLVHHHNNGVELWDIPKNREDDPHYITRIHELGWICGWMPLPSLPKKKHYCNTTHIKCEKTSRGLFLIDVTLDTTTLASIPCKFCPICGEEA